MRLPGVDQFAFPVWFQTNAPLQVCWPCAVPGERIAHGIVKIAEAQSARDGFPAINGPVTARGAIIRRCPPRTYRVKSWVFCRIYRKRNITGIIGRCCYRAKGGLSRLLRVQCREWTLKIAQTFFNIAHLMVTAVKKFLNRFHLRRKMA